ncbi:MAG TPA: GAF domain-containing protein [Archangium sp.]|uniref:GAF domain-containing protein n=1 Tax=Archangium sp. TaxID=1872627 RepID=UPI002E377071|nr:GAF domain-containing protein [Archangium sp.]HEX5751578.1 GAF domain-containing protein [Archangium sp.]
MNFVPPKDMSVLDDAERLASFDAPLLESTPDPELQALVTEATTLTGFPIGLVSLVVRKIQFFRAQVGLPPDLSATLATDRCTSFCQFVVARGDCLEIEDAEREPGLPRDLVERYGIRAYVGFPLEVQGQTVGSFCVIDAKPARLTPEVLTKLRALARRASARLEELARQVPAPASSSEAEAQARNAWLAVAEAQPLLSLSERYADGQISFEEFQRGLGALAGLSGSSE